MDNLIIKVISDWIKIRVEHEWRDVTAEDRDTAVRMMDKLAAVLRAYAD